MSWRTVPVCLAVLLAAVAGASRYHQGHARFARLQLAFADGKAEGDHVADDLAYALARWPDSADVHLIAARVCRLKGDPLGTDFHLTRANAIGGGATAATQLEYLLLRVQTGEVDELAGPLETMVEGGHPDSVLILETVARAYMHQLRYHPAILVLNRWVELAPTSATPYFWRGWVLERMNDAANAKEQYAKALERDPLQSRARLRLAEMYLADIRPGDARPHLERLRVELPDSAEVVARLGVCHFLEGDTRKARDLLTAVAARLPADPSPALTLGRLELQADRPAAAEPWLRTAGRIDPADTEVMFALADCLSALGRDEEAEAARRRYHEYTDLLKTANKKLQDMARTPTNDPQEAYDIGDVLLRIGQPKTGVYWLNRALELRPNFPAAHARLAAHYDAVGDAATAATHRKALARPGK